MIFHVKDTSPPCCLSCKECVDESRNRIHGPPDTIHEECIRLNRFPSDPEEFIKERISARGYLNRLEETLTVLQTERTRLQSILAKYNVILHPVRRTPPEIIRKIFTFCVDRPRTMEVGDMSLFPQTSLNPLRMPWVLGQVCRSWRTLALSTPTLWSTVVLRVSSITDMEPQISSHALRLGLQTNRSQNHPMDVWLSLQCGRALHPLTAILCTWSQQWRSLRLEGEGDAIQHLGQIQHFLPMLEHLYIGVSPTVHEVACFDKLPRLKSLILNRTIGMTKLPLHQLLRFHWVESGVTKSPRFVERGLWPMLSSLRNVESVALEFSTNGCVRQLRRGLPALMFPRLQSLELSCHDNCFVGLDQLVERVTAPRLTHLSLRVSLSEGCSDIVEFIRRSSCGLSSLVVHSAAPASTAGISELLALAPELTYLELGLACITDGDLRIFSATPALVPRLETLSIFAYPGHSTHLYSDTVLLDILEYRCTDEQLISRLRSVQVDRSITEYPRLQALRSNGLVVVGKET